MESHIQLLKYAVETPLPQVRKEVKELFAGTRKRTSFRNSSKEITSGRITSIKEEKFVDVKTGNMVTLHRVFVRSSEGGKYNLLGWIHLSEVANCMICGNKFGALRAKRSCCACGCVVCVQCSPNKAMLAEIRTNEPIRVCCKCFTGQVRRWKGLCFICDDLGLCFECV